MRTMLAITLGLLVIVFATPSPAQITPEHLWSEGFGSTGDDDPIGVAVDASGNVFVTGYFSGTANFGGGNLVCAGPDDIFLAKYNANGVHQWSQRFGGTGEDVGRDVAVDASGNVFVTGYFNDTVNFGGGDLVSAGSFAMFVAKFNASGVHQWSQRFGVGGADSAVGLAIAVDASANVVVTGDFQGTVDFGGGNLVSAGSDDVFLAKYDASGVHQWSQRFGDTGSDAGHAVAVDGSGNVVVTGDFNGTVNFGGGNLVSAGDRDIFLAKYSASGVHQWSQRFGSTVYDTGVGIAVDASENVFVTGFFNGTVDFGGGSLVSAGGRDIFLAKYNASGLHQWSKRFGDAGDDVGTGIAVDGSGNVFATGSFNGTVNFGGGNWVSAGGNDMFVVKFNAGGGLQWSRGVGGAGNDSGYGVAAEGLGRAVVAGSFQGTVNFGGGGIVSAGDSDVFLAMYGNPALITQIVDGPFDNGTHVEILFKGSAHDAPGSTSARVAVSGLPSKHLARRTAMGARR